MPITELTTSLPLFPGFRLLDIEVPGSRVRLRAGGNGPPLLLLHGYPQTHVLWHKVAAILSARFTIIAADLRGYGDSAKPAGGADHAAYSKRAMAGDLVAAMAALGHDRFFVGSHDRGARVGHRMALDHPRALLRLATLDIAPTREMYAGTSDAFARAYWHWFFLIQPAPFPERMIGADPDAYWLKKCGSGSAGLTQFDPAALAEYLRCFRDPATIHASCEDYRAAATIDLVHDRESRAAGRRIECPVLALWGAKGKVGQWYKPLDIWRDYARGPVTGGAVNSGHYLPEEAPGEVLAMLDGFLNPTAG